PGVTIACSPASGSAFPVGVTTVTCTASDASASSPDSTCTFTVTVTDTQVPVIVCPGNITVTGTATSGCTFTAVVNYPAPTATDNCGIGSVACVPPSGSTFNEGTTTVTCTATDTSGNTATCTFTVTVGVAFGYCAIDDATGDRFQLVVDPMSPSYGTWRYTVVATNTVYCGKANFVNYVPGVRLRAYDNDYSAENPTFFMDANFKATSGTVTVRNVSGTVRLTLRDRNLLNNVCP
ncbi:MAG: HYR domain-containing protein, partial [Acidobacteria bacterium]|nr:HYR domain-containing protein [Acidobacteriota bacterium]